MCVFIRFGGDLLSHDLSRSTIGAVVLNCRVRDGIGCFTHAIATKPGKNTSDDAAKPGICVSVRRRRHIRGMCERHRAERCLVSLQHETLMFRCLSTLLGTHPIYVRFRTVTGSYQANRAISTGQLNGSHRLHLQPIDVVVFHGPQGRPCFEGGFPLRCFQRLSCPIIATQHCPWQDNWSTSGSFTPVLSY